MELSDAELWKIVRQDLKPLKRACEGIVKSAFSTHPA